MKITKTTMFATLCLLICSGCAQFQNFQHIFQNPKNKTVTVEEEVPQDRETVVTEVDTIQYSPAKLQQGTLSGDWAIISVKGNIARGEYPPFIKFSQKDNCIYGNNGCNVINAYYNSNPADSTLTFSNVITTTKSCAMEDLTDLDINFALNNTRFYIIEKNDSQHFLHFLDVSKSAIMTLMHQDFDFLNGAWNVVEINDHEIDNQEMQLVFDIAEMKIHGNTGCNILNGSLETDLETANAISFQRISTTRMSCLDSSNETELLVALEEAMYVNPLPNNEVELLNSKGVVILRLIRANLSQY